MKFVNLKKDSLYRHVGLLSAYYPNREMVQESKECVNKRGGDSQVKCWVNDLVDQFLKREIPVICLMFYDGTDNEGHYRVAVGYETVNDVVTNIIMWDPYNREGNPPISNFTIDEFCKLWNYTELKTLNSCYKPYYGAALFPLQINIKNSHQNTYKITVKSPCMPSSFISTTLRDLNLEVTVLGHEEQIDNEKLSPVLQVDKLSLSQQLDPCEEQSAHWTLPPHLENSVSKIRVIAKGSLCDESPTWIYRVNAPTLYSPRYKYCDVVGGYTLLTV